MVQGEQTAQLTERDMVVRVKTKYLLYLPGKYKQSGKNWPLMLFLHGAGERGNDLEKVKLHGPPKLIAKGKKFPFLVVSPQCPENQSSLRYGFEYGWIRNVGFGYQIPEAVCSHCSDLRRRRLIKSSCFERLANLGFSRGKRFNC